MARIRTIKPEFFTSLTISTLGTRAKLLFLGTWCHVDDGGRCVDDPRLIKAAVYPLDEKITPRVVESLLCELADAGLIIRYEVQNRRYLQVTNWLEHQRINRPAPSKLPPPPGTQSVNGHRGLTEDSLSLHGGLTVGKERNREQGKEQGIPPPLSDKNTQARRRRSGGGDGESIDAATLDEPRSITAILGGTA